jgi:predicted transcriptional regulator
VNPVTQLYPKHFFFLIYAYLQTKMRKAYSVKVYKRGRRFILASSSITLLLLKDLNIMKYRSRTDIVGLILEAANGGGATKTKIMYKALISYNLMKEYLTLLAENDLLEYEQGNMTYRTTEKGLHLLKIYNNMNEIASLSITRSVDHKNTGMNNPTSSNRFELQ